MTTPHRDPLAVLRASVARIGTTADDVLDSLTRFNSADPMLIERMTVIAESAKAIATIHGSQPGAEIANLLADLHSGLRTFEVPEEDPELGETYALRELASAHGRLYLLVDRAIAAATALGLAAARPELPAEISADVPRAGNEALLRDIAAGLDDIVEQLDRLDQAGAEPTDFRQQQGLIEFYLGRMRVQVDLVRTQLTVGERTVDFAALQRASATMKDLTGDFVATIRDWAERVAGRVRDLVTALPRRVRTFTTRIITATRTILSRREAVPKEPGPDEPERPSPPEGFDLKVVHEMILRGETPPRAWWPLITALKFGPDYAFRDERSALADLRPLAPLVALHELHLVNTAVTDLTPIAALTGLQSLYLYGTQVSDITPIAALTGLQSLDLRNTRVSDITPIAALTELQSLRLNGTRVSDITPIAALTALQALHLSGTQVSDITPIAALTALQHLNLSDTRVSDITPIAALTGLEILDLSATKVSDITPIAALTGLQSLYLYGTQVSDITPIAALAGLEILDLRHTQVSDITPIAALTALQSLRLNGTRVSDITPIAALTELEILDLDGTHGTDVSSLRHLRKLTIEGGNASGPVGTATQLIDRLFRRRT